MKNSQNKKKNPRYEFIVMIAIIVVAVIGILVYVIGQRIPSKTYEDLNAYYSLENENEAAIVVDGTIEAEHAQFVNGQYYISYEEILSAINKRLYYDETENLFCVATPTELHTFDIDELKNEGDVTETDGKLSVSLDFVKEWSDVDVTVSEEPSRLTFTTEWDYETRLVSKDECIRVRPSIKGNILHSAAAGESVRLMEEEDENETPDGWVKVTTEDGLTGYMRSDYLEEEGTIPAEHVSHLGDYNSLSLGESVNMAFYQSDNPSMNTTLSDKLEKTSGLNVICPTWFFLDGPGEVTTNFDSDFVALCHEKGCQVWALLNDIDGAVTTSEGTTAALSATSDRRKLIETLISTSLAYGIDGINVDLEHVSEEGVYAYLEFIRELSIECRASGLILSVDTYVPMNYSLYLDREEQGKVADYVVIMCYDEHYSGSEEAGSVASLNFLENGLSRALREVEAGKLIAAIPFYTRLWTTTSQEAPDSSVMSMKEALAYAEANGMEIVWDEETGQNVAELEENGALYQIWLEDGDSIEAKMKKISDYHIGGVAEWCLGEETEDVWGVISEYLNQ